MISFDDVNECREHALALARNSRREITIFTPDLEPLIYDTDDFLSAALDFIKGSKQTRVRIIVRDTRALVEEGHKLLRLFRYADEQFQIRKLTSDPASYPSAYLISDNQGLLRRPNAIFYRGVCYPDDRSRVKNQREEFDELWHVAALDNELRTLTL